MPSLPSKSRRKGITPFKKANQEHVWKSTLDYLGVEPMISDSTFNKAVGEAPTTMASPSQKMTLGGLPAEILKAIFQDSPSPDLVALSLVSKQFHTIAAEHLYRTFHIVFPDEDDSLNDALIDGLAAGLDTFATSEYDYAAHLREIILETVSGDVGRERSYRHYLFDVSCGKFMSTLLALTLRKAKSLETFRWDIRVELSRPVFKTLHNIDALQNLHLRMHAGPSLYLAPPDLNSSTTPSSTNQTYVQINGSHIAPISTSKSFKNGSKESTEAQSNTLKKLLPPTKAAPPTLSGFKHLKSLSILDMDTLEYIDELNTCVRNCSSSLKILKLSFSEALANRSRKPPPEPQSDSESDPEGLDQFQGMPPPGIPNMPLPNPLAGASDPNGPIRVLKAQQEKKRQEAALGRILGRAPVLKPSTVEAIEFSEKADKELAKDPRRRFIEKLTPVAAKLMGHIKPKSEDTPAGKKALELIKKAANMYLDSIDKDQASAGSSTAKETPPSSPTTNGGEIIMTGAIEPGLFDDKPEPKSKSDETGVSNPDDIDMDEPEVKDSDVEEEAKLDPDQDIKTIRTAYQEMTADIQEMRRQCKEDTAGMDEHHPLRPLGVKLLAEIEQLEGLLVVRDQQKSIENAHAMEAEMDAQMASVVAESLNFSRDLRSYLQSLKQEAKELLTVDTMSEYVRNTHGLTLDSLAIYLLPIKASVLGRAIDFTTLRSITLLHVGTQVPFWTFMEKMNKESPLPLSRIHSDHVSSSLLHFVAELKRPEELYFIERDPKLSRVEITAPKTNVKIDQIRKIVLKKHAGNLKVFLLRNAKADWNLDTKTVTLLCQKGKQLEELAASFGLPAIHTFMQQMPGLTSLRVFHAINIVYNDECPFINTQFRKFMLDICTHIPELKLEYMASLDSVERLVRRKAVPKVRKGSDKGKEKATATHIDDALGNIWANYPDPNLSPTSTGSGWTASGSINSSTGQHAEFPDSSDDEDDLKPATKIETVGDIKYQEVIGVKIWEKEVVSNRL